MIESKTFRQLALSFPEATEEAHFEKTSFRVRNKIFATLDEKNSRAVIKLSEIDQSVFSSFDQTIIYPVEGAWGKKGWTVVELNKIRKKMLQDALTVSYSNVAPKKTSAKFK